MNTKVEQLVFIILFLCVVIQCRDNNDEPDDLICEDPYEVSPLVSQNSDIVFDENRLMTYYLTVEPEDWSWLTTHAAEEEYVRASLNVGCSDIGTVGLRFKGSYGTLTLCLDEEGNRVCPKLSMKIKFSEYDLNNTENILVLLLIYQPLVISSYVRPTDCFPIIQK